MRPAAAIVATVVIIIAVSAGLTQHKGRTPTGSPVTGVVALVRTTAPQSDPFQGQFCAGILVRVSSVLTAAHCVTSLSPRDVVALVDGDNLCSGAPIEGTFVPVVAVSIDPGYDAAVGVHDLAVLTLAEGARSTPLEIGPGGAPGPATAYGWGRGPGGAPSCTLQRIQLEVPSQAECPSLFKDSSRPFVPDSMICALGDDGGNTCQGDSGGPLIAGIDDSAAKVIGVVSWGLGCTGPGVYARAMGVPIGST